MVQKGFFHIIIGIPVNAHFRTNAGDQGVVAMGEKSTPVFEYLAEEVPVFREVGETKAHYSKVSKWPAVGGHVEFRDGWGCSAACG